MNEYLQQDLKSGIFPEGTRVLLESLYSLNQDHLFENWDPSGDKRSEKIAFIESLHSINSNYPGGLDAYIKNAQKLLEDARTGKNPFEGFKPQPPQTIDLSKDETLFYENEHNAVEKIDKLAIAMVAGGLGERLGYEGIKIQIPFELCRLTTYLELYCKTILAYQQEFESSTGKFTEIPFLIMVSQDTDDLTIEALKSNNYYGLNPSQVQILKQELVPAIQDNDARLALDSPYNLQLKPHGHGDIHLLLYQTGLYSSLYEQGKKYLALIQDTNGQVINALLPSLAVSIKHQLHFNSITVPRVAGEAVGAIAALKSETPGKSSITINIEYNQLDPLLKATVNPEGDVGDEQGMSPYPGNINAILLELGSYREVLSRSGGQIPEFVNPKYADSSRTTFKKPTRLETMMQDLPKVFDESKKVGVTMFDRKLVFSPDKNNITDAGLKFKAGQPPECAATAESDFYAIWRKRLKSAGNSVSEDKEPTIFNGVPYMQGTRLMLDPLFISNQQQLKDKIKDCIFGRDSVLIVQGAGVKLKNVELKAKTALHLELTEGCNLLVQDMTFDEDKGIDIVELSTSELEDQQLEQYLRIRGYRFDSQRVIHVRVKKPGKYELQDDLTLKQLY
jgi:UDP-sugar pyrophosphorylase